MQVESIPMVSSTSPKTEEAIQIDKALFTETYSNYLSVSTSEKGTETSDEQELSDEQLKEVDDKMESPVFNLINPFLRFDHIQISDSDVSHKVTPEEMDKLVIPTYHANQLHEGLNALNKELVTDIDIIAADIDSEEFDIVEAKYPGSPVYLNEKEEVKDLPSTSKQPSTEVSKSSEVLKNKMPVSEATQILDGINLTIDSQESTDSSNHILPDWYSMSVQTADAGPLKINEKELLPSVDRSNNKSSETLIPEVSADIEKEQNNTAMTVDKPLDSLFKEVASVENKMGDDKNEPKLDTAFNTGINQTKLTEMSKPFVQDKNEEPLFTKEQGLNKINEMVTELLQDDSGKDYYSSTIRLTPEKLGEVTIEIQFKKGELTGKLSFQNEESKQLMESEWSKFSLPLESKGVRLRSFEFLISQPAQLEQNSLSFSNESSHSGQKQQHKKTATHNNRDINSSTEENEIADVGTTVSYSRINVFA